MIDKAFLFVLIFAILVIIKDILEFCEINRKDKTVGIFGYLTNMKLGSMLSLGASISYIFTIIFTGFNV